LAQEEDAQSDQGERGNADPERGESLMFNRTLLKIVVEQEPPQRKTLFKTLCKVKGKVYKVIVDSGSTNNIASVEMVNKLGLKRSPHPNPYKVSWLSKEQQVVVNEQVNVEFQIGEYKDKIVCDVADMDACHLLLGRPW
jgi:hypothetical protein